MSTSAAAANKPCFPPKYRVMRLAETPASAAIERTVARS
jgi:hypothetical protein